MATAMGASALLRICAVAALLGCSARVSVHTGQPRIEVVVRTTAGDPVPGAAVSLCPWRDGEGVASRLLEVQSEGCSRGHAASDGRVTFSAIQPGRYFVTAELSGFAATTVHPLSIASTDPLAPDTLLVVLNPVCFHCANPTQR